MKTLPFTFPPIETWQSTSFLLAILISYENTKNVLYNKYVNINGVDTDQIWDLQLDFDDVLWDGYYEEGIIDTNYYHANTLDKASFSMFLDERIDQNFYICFYKEDDYYLSHSKSYLKNHFTHDIYVYGDFGDSYMCMGYKDDRLQEFLLPKKEIVDAFFSEQDDCDDRSFGTIRVRNNVYVDIDYDLIKEELYQYFYGSSTCCDRYRQNTKQGIHIYSIIRRCLAGVELDFSPTAMDIREFRMLWEHKKLMSLRLRKIAEKYDIGDALSICDKVENLAKQLYMLSLKFNLKRNNVVNSMQLLLNDIEQYEKQLGAKLMKAL